MKEVIADLKKVNITYISSLLISFVISFFIQKKIYSRLFFKFNWIGIIYIIVIIVIHEGLHGLGFIILAKAPRNKVKFGFHKQYFTPYCACNDYPMTKFGYISTLLLPSIIIVIATAAILFSTSNIFWSIVFSWVVASGSGDYYMAYLVSTYESRVKFMDHPKEPGFFVLE